MIWNWKKMNAAKKAMIRRGGIVLAAYEVVFTGAFVVAHKTEPGTAGLFLLAALTTLPVLAFIVVMGRYLGEEVDEFHRQLVVRCLLWGLAAVMTSVCFHGLLQLYGWKGNWPAGVELAVNLLAMLVAKLTYRVQNRVPEDAEVLVRHDA
jgi:hypothetical protein